MQKGLIILLLIISGGCSVKRFVIEKSPNYNEESVERIIDAVRKKNLTEESFFIEKANFELTRSSETTKFLFSVKFIKPDKYLFSIRSTTGIEGARIYITKDTVLINERMGKRLLYGKPIDLEKISGLPYFVINIAFGDMYFCDNNEMIKSERINNEVNITQQCQGKLWNIVLDTKVEKVKSVVFSTGINDGQIKMRYSKFQSQGNHMPMIIEMEDLRRQIKAKVKVERMQIPWQGEIEFLPGKGYAKEEIK